MTKERNKHQNSNCYDGVKFPFPITAVDMVIFTIISQELKVLLIKMKKSPFETKWALPGGLVNNEESLDEAAKRELQEKTGVKNVYLEQLYSFGAVRRDPLRRVVSVAYFALIDANSVKLKTTKKYAGVDWFSAEKCPALAYDHEEILNYAICRLRAKLGYTNVVYSLLPKKFTLAELQKVYEIILAKSLDKRNFRKKILALNLLRKTDTKTKGAFRPAELYEFKQRRPEIVKIM